MAGAYGRNFAASAGAAAQEHLVLPGSSSDHSEQPIPRIEEQCLGDIALQAQILSYRCRALVVKTNDPEIRAAISLANRACLFGDITAATAALAAFHAIKKPLTTDPLCAMIDQAITATSNYIAFKTEQATFSLPPAGADLSDFLGSKGKLLPAELEAMVRLEATCAVKDLLVDENVRAICMRLQFGVGERAILNIMRKYHCYPSDLLKDTHSSTAGWPFVDADYLAQHRVNIHTTKRMIESKSERPDCTQLKQFDHDICFIQQRAMQKLAQNCVVPGTELPEGSTAESIFENQFGAGFDGVINFSKTYGYEPSQALCKPDKTAYKPFVNQCYIECMTEIAIQAHTKAESTSFKFTDSNLILLPACISLLTKVTFLDLKDNNMDVLPAQILQLPDLAQLALRRNHEGIHTRTRALKPDGYRFI